MVSSHTQEQLIELCFKLDHFLETSISGPLQQISTFSSKTGKLEDWLQLTPPVRLTILNRGSLDFLNSFVCSSTESIYRREVLYHQFIRRRLVKVNANGVADIQGLNRMAENGDKNRIADNRVN